MPRKKKTKFGGIIGVILVGAVALIAAVPREVWIVLGIVIALGVAVYLYNKSKSDSAAEQQERATESLVERPKASEATRLRTMRQASHSRGDDTPSSIAAGPVSASKSFRVPTAPQGFGQAQWLSPNEIVTVSGVTIPGGLIYMGTTLPTPAGENDPCLIDPSKPVARRGDYTQREMGYWPSYSEISASARRAYLNWLADGRKDPQADVGYVFMFFYGLERRAIVDAAKVDSAKLDWPIIASELRRLLAIYGDKSGSFRGYASSLLDWVSLAEHPEKAYLKPIPTFPKTYELPLYIRAALGQSAVDGAPVPPALALVWAKLDPANNLRTPAIRCADEFDRLFVDKYKEAFGQGMVIPKNRTKLKLVHRPASAAFRGYNELSLTFGETPDVTVLTAPLKKLQQIVESATKELEPFSRYVGKNPDAKHVLEGLLQLPATLWPESAQNILMALQKRMGGGMIALSFQELLVSLDAQTTLSRDRILALARALESLNIGIEPDVLAGAKLPKPEEHVVLFVVPPGEASSRSTPAYQAAALTLDLASAVAVADGAFSPKEINQLRCQVQAWTHLSPNHLRRLLAHLRLRIAAPASLTALRKKLEPLDPAAKGAIAAFMATVAQSDGVISATEVKMLEKVYKALGVDPNKVFSDVHAVAAGATQTGARTTKPENTGLTLDPARIAALQKDTEAVSALLADIFKDEEMSVPVPLDSDSETETEAEAPSTGLLGLDEAHSALARLLLSRPEWTREEIADAVADLDLMIDGALETINEAAFDKHEVPFVEGEESLKVNPELLEKLAA